MEKNNRTAIIVALITLTGVISAAVLSNWDKIGKTNKDPDTSLHSGPTNQNSDSYKPSQPPKVIKYDSIASALVTNWFSALDNSDIDYLVSASEAPFYFHHDFLLTTSQIRDFYRTFLESKKSMGEVGIFKVGTIARFKADGLTGKYLDITRLNLNDDDYFVQLGQTSREGGLVFIFKKTRETLKLNALLAS